MSAETSQTVEEGECRSAWRRVVCMEEPAGKGGGWWERRCSLLAGLGGESCAQIGGKARAGPVLPWAAGGFFSPSHVSVGRAVRGVGPPRSEALVAQDGS